MGGQMSKYDELDARTELEQAIAADLRRALQKRGFRVRHNGTPESSAPAGTPDILVTDDDLAFTFEATRARGAAQDRELNSIRDHLNQIKQDNPAKRCYCVFVSPETSRRMIDGIRDHNHQRASEGLNDMRILPLCFDTVELWSDRLLRSDADLYPVDSFRAVFDQHVEFIDDLRVRKVLLEQVFPSDEGLFEAVRRQETELDQKTLERLVRDLARMEDYMRQHGVAVGRAAIDNLIYLVFLKLYEEKRERNGDANRLRSVGAFEHYRRNSVSAPVRREKRAIHDLFNDVKQEGEFLSSGMFTRGDSLAETLRDDFVIDRLIPMFSDYTFLGTHIDALGAVYEVLALRAEKDVKVGQFFTPENVVRFMVSVADLDYRDLVLDPACGTGRFLIWAMLDMLGKLQRSDEHDKEHQSEQIRLHRLFGADIDDRIAKIAKMNMWIHGDGKANVFGGPAYNGLTLHRHGFDSHESFDDAFDVVLTNPPLGELNYRAVAFVDRARRDSAEATLARMPVLPRKSRTADRLDTVRKRLSDHEHGLAELEAAITIVKREERVREWLALEAHPRTQDDRRRRRELGKTEEVREYRRLRSRASRKQVTIDKNEHEARELEVDVRRNECDWAITGNTMKGGALFLAAIWHYLKDISRPNMPPEWKGGRMLIILDEGILNTDNYAEVRDFLRSHFYVKAVFSLTRDTFVPVSKTSTKTSILYAIKKTGPDVAQREPVFFGHVERVGLDTRGKSCPNDSAAMLERYLDFKAKVLSSYSGLEFREDWFDAQGFEAGGL